MWHIDIHGLTDHLNPDVAKEAEQRVVAAAHELVGTLAPDGHQGVAATFAGDHYPAVNLVDPRGVPVSGAASQGGPVADGTPGPAPDAPPPSFPGSDTTGGHQGT